jgi:addiction module HigA family antidote
MLKRGMPPTHPGEILREDYLKELQLTVTEAAKGLKVTRNSLSSIINGKAGVSPEMAVKLSVAFGTSSMFWLNLQRTYDLWQAEQKVDRSEIRTFSPTKAA